MSTFHKFPTPATFPAPLVSGGYSPPRRMATPHVLPKSDEDEVVCSLTNKSTSKLNIYLGCGHLANKYMDSPEIITLPKSVQVSSIIVIGANGTPHPFEFIPGANSHRALTDKRHNDARVKWKHGEIYGKIIDQTETDVTVMSTTSVVKIHKYDSIEVPSFGNTHPQIRVGGGKPLTVSYLFGGIGWTCVGTGLVNKTEDQLTLQLSAMIANTTDHAITADITLTNGDIKSEEILDYTKYGVGIKTIDQAAMADLKTVILPITKVYVYHTDWKTTKVGYQSTVPQNIPECKVNLYMLDDWVSFIGEHPIEEKKKGDDLIITIGNASSLQCISAVTTKEINGSQANLMKEYKLSPHVGEGGEHKWHVHSESITVNITNYNITEVKLVLKHFVGNKMVVGKKCEQYKHNPNGFIEWLLTIPPKTKEIPFIDEWTCEVITAEYK